MISTLYEPFRHWSEGGSIYILSDLHFDDIDCKIMNLSWITLLKAKKKILLLGNHDTKGTYRKIIKDGAISDIPSIHRVTIDGAVLRKRVKENG